MMQTLIGAGALAALFVVFGLMQRGRERSPCDHCSCRGGICERTGKPRHTKLVE